MKVIDFSPAIVVSGSQEANRFLVELPHFGNIIATWQGIILILGCTTLPYFIYYWLATSWPRYTSFELWVTTLQLIEPIVNLILGVTVLNENFPVVWLFVIIFLIGIGIVMRYLSETETQIFVVFLIRIQSKDSFPAMKKLFTLRSVRSVRNIIGNYDLMCEAQLRSASNLNKLIQKHIVTLPGLIKYELLILDMSKSIIR